MYLLGVLAHTAPHDRMKDQAAATVADGVFANRADRYPVDTPDTKEAYWIREIFEGASDPLRRYSLTVTSVIIRSLPVGSGCQDRCKVCESWRIALVNRLTIPKQVDTTRRLGLCGGP